MFKITNWLILLVAFVLSSCGVDEREYDYTKPDSATITQGESHTFSSSINWNNNDESTKSIQWTGSGTAHLNNTATLNPTFTGTSAGDFSLTQTIKSSQGKTIEATITMTVTADNGGGGGGGGGGGNNGSVDDIQAARFLQQATFGPSMSEIAKVKQIGYEQWIDEQVALPVTTHSPILVQKRNEKWRWQAWSIQSTYAPDQLRQRMGFAFSEIMTISMKAVNALYNQQAGVVDYYDMLLENSLGNYRELLEDVTRHAAMGIYLTYLGNSAGERPDENYAREIMQLFSIGLVELNMDGTAKRDGSGNTIATYNQQTVEQFAKIFTGLCYSQPLNSRFCHPRPKGDTFSLPMKMWAEAHDKGEKRLLNGKVVPANQNAEKDLEDALDNLANHANTAPFISKLLIKRLVTSNPSPKYVERVAKIFSSTNGDLAAVAKAILLDSEARSGQNSNSFGKLREPLIKMTHLFRALDATMPMGDAYRFGDGQRFYEIFGQAPFYSPSVFNFFMPDFSPNSMKTQNLVAPEFQILSTSQLVITENMFNEFAMDPAIHYPNIDVSSLVSLYDSGGIDALLGRINILFTSGLMSESMKSTIKTQATQLRSTSNDTEWAVRNIIAFVMQSPEFSIQR